MLPHATGLRAAAYRTSYAANEHFNLARQPPFDVLSKPPGHRLFVKMFKELDRLRTAAGLGGVDMAGMFDLAEELNVVMMTREFHPAADTFDERFLFTGPSIARALDERRDPSGEARGRGLRLDGDGVPRSPELYRMCLSARGFGLPVILGCGTLAAELAPEAPSNFVVKAEVPQLEVLEHASAFVTHGGMGSVMESLYFGVPMLVLPQMLEQAVTATRVEELGVGAMRNVRSLDATGLRDAVLSLREIPAFRARAREMQRATRNAGGYRRAASAILTAARRVA